MHSLLGIDVGTTGTKAELITTKGESIVSAYKEYPLLYPRPNWVETDPEGGWWEACVETIQKIVSQNDVNPSNIAGISISCTNALVAVDKEGKALHNAIMQLDKRTVPQANWIVDRVGAEKIGEITGNRVAAGATSAPIILWMKENKPELFEKTYKFLWPTGFVIAKLTGHYTMEWSRASWTCFFDTGKNRTYSKELCEKMGIPIEKLPTTCPPWEIIGEVSKRAAKETGLAEGTPVVGGMADTPAAALGTNATKPNDFFYVLGTVGRPVLILGKPKFDTRFLNCCHAVPDTWMSLAALDGGSVNLRWFRDIFGQLEVSISDLIDESPYVLLDQEAEKSPPGAGGLIYFPYISGSRANVIWDSNAKAILFGANLATKREDVIRAILEGVTFALRHNQEAYEEDVGARIDKVMMSGGGSNSRLWRQITADITGKPVHAIKRTASESIGNAVLAGFGTGIFDDIGEAANQMVEVVDIIEPREEYKQVYDELFELYKELYDSIKGEFSKLMSISNKYGDLWKE